MSIPVEKTIKKTIISKRGKELKIKELKSEDQIALTK
jgi:hypothetical protein